MLTLRRIGVSDPRVLAAFDACARSAFMDSEFESLAHEDVSIPLPCGQTSLRPSALALMLEALQVEAHHRALLVGVGSGYGAAILARLAAHVVALDRYTTLCDLTAQNLAQSGAANVVVEQADGLSGFAASAPYDRILATGAVEAPPEALLAQLAPEGLLIAPLRLEAGVGRAQVRCWRKAGASIIQSDLFWIDSQPLEAGIAKRL